MEIKNTNRNTTKKRLIIIAAALVLLLGAGGVSAYFITQEQQKNTRETSENSSPSETPALDTPATEDEIQTGNTAKDNTVNGTDTPASDMSITVTASNTGSMIRIMTEINKITSQGSCSVSLTQGDKTIKKESVAIQPLSSYSTCNGWDIANSELSSGKWTVTVTATSGSQSASATTEVSL